jgi:hypothetical protein
MKSLKGVESLISAAVAGLIVTFLVQYHISLRPGQEIGGRGEAAMASTVINPGSALYKGLIEGVRIPQNMLPPKESQTQTPRK